MAEQSYQEFLNNIPIDRRVEVEKVWQMVKENMPDGYLEDIGDKYLSFQINNVSYVSLANQKNYISLHLMPIYMFPELKAKLEKSNKKIKGGKGCLNFKKAEELPLDIIGEIISATSADDYQAIITKFKNKGKASS